MTKDAHFTALETMYLAGPINELYRPTIDVSDSTATIEIQVSEQFFHAAGALHGSVYFKMLDDVAFFAANSIERDVFVVTASFETRLLRPVTSGSLRAVGTVVDRTRSKYMAEAVVYNEGLEVGRGSGVFVRTKVRLSEVVGYEG